MFTSIQNIQLKIIFIFIIAGFLLLTCGKVNIDENKEGWMNLILEHLNRYPEMEVQDLYKFIYQATLGPAHLGTNEKIILSYLNREIESINADPEIDLVENISPSGKYVRINLKKFKDKSGNIKLLANVIALSAKEKVLSERIPLGNMEILNKRWEMVARMVDSGDLPFDREEFRQFSDFIISNKSEIPHHSKKYRECYSPSYRVVLKNYWDEVAREVFN